MIISLIIEGIICVLVAISSFFSGKTVRNNKKIKTKLNEIEEEVIHNIDLHKHEIDEINTLFGELETKIKKLSIKKENK